MSNAQDYLRDILPLILERGRVAREDHKRALAAGDPRCDFDAGRATAYYQVLSTLIGQLEAFGISTSDVGVPVDLNLEKELLP